MKLVWKLLRQHISVPQFVGYFFANMFGMFIVLLGVQFYNDIVPVFTAEDSFMKADYLIISKKIGAGSTIGGGTSAFSNDDIENMKHQRFVKQAGVFTGNEFKVEAKMGVSGQNVLNSEIFLESVPDHFVDTPLANWTWKEGDNTVPIILPRTYINMYNFGYAQSHSLPKISDGLVGMIDFSLFIHGGSKANNFKGRVIGFSNRLNTILVPQAFMDWANTTYAPGEKSNPTRMIVEVGNPGDQNVTKYLDDKGYDVENSQLDAEKTTYFLRMVVMLVMMVGLVISVLSFYILMLSIYLLVQKNSSKLENLLLIGYSPAKVAWPYQLLTICLNVAVLLIAVVVLWFVREYYMDIVFTLYPQMNEGTMLPTLITGLVLFVLVTIVNQTAIRRKIMSIWNRKD